MTLGEVRREALRLMFAGYEDILEEMTFSELYQNERYQPYVMGIDMGVNRAVSYLSSQNLLPTVYRTGVAWRLPSGDVGLDTGAFVPAVGKVSGVEDEEMDGVAFHTEGTTLVVPFSYEGRPLRVRYSPKWVRVDNMTPDDYELPLSDEVAALLPYWVKSELYEEENPSAARLARSYFLEGADRLRQNDGEGVSFVVKYHL